MMASWTTLMSLLFRKNSLVLLLEIDTGGVDFVVEGKVKEREGGADVDGSLLDDLGVVSPFRIAVKTSVV